jgi:hypothetical protein
MSRKSHFLAAALVGGFAAWLWKLARLKSHATPHGEITRWEDEGGAVHSLDEQPAAASASRPAASLNGIANGLASNGAEEATGSTPDAWKFPRA